WERPHRQQLAVDTQVPVALVGSPLGEIRVHALAIEHQRREQGDFSISKILQDASGDDFLALRLDRALALRAVLRAELDEEQAQEVMHLGQRTDGRLAAAAARALLDRYGRRDAEDRVDIGARGRLHELAR